MEIKQKEVYTSRYFRRGGSYGIFIPPDIRELMHFKPGDVLLMNCDQGVLWVVRATKQMAIDRTKVTAIFERLYAEKRPESDKHV